MAQCRFGDLASFQWKCAAAQRRFGVGAVFFADMFLSMHKPWVSKRELKSAGGLPTNLCDFRAFRPAPIGVFFCPLACLMLVVHVASPCASPASSSHRPYRDQKSPTAASTGTTPGPTTVPRAHYREQESHDPQHNFPVSRVWKAVNSPEVSHWQLW